MDGNRDLKYIFEGEKIRLADISVAGVEGEQWRSHLSTGPATDTWTHMVLTEIAGLR